MPRWIEITLFWSVVFFVFVCLMQNESIRVENRGRIEATEKDLRNVNELAVQNLGNSLRTITKPVKSHRHNGMFGEVLAEDELGAE